MDLGDDRGVDVGRLTAIAAAAPAPGGRLGRLAHRTFVDPLFGLPRLDLLAFGVFVTWRSRPPLGTDLGGTALGFGTRLGPLKAIASTRPTVVASPARTAAIVATPWSSAARTATIVAATRSSRAAAVVTTPARTTTTTVVISVAAASAGFAAAAARLAGATTTSTARRAGRARTAARSVITST